MKHEFKVEGSDTPPRQMIGGCTCGWWGTVIDGQGRESDAEAKRQWEEHAQAEKQLEERAA